MVIARGRLFGLCAVEKSVVVGFSSGDAVVESLYRSGVNSAPSYTRQEPDFRKLYLCLGSEVFRSGLRAYLK
jgi:hypothetical protein